MAIMCRCSPALVVFLVIEPPPELARIAPQSLHHGATQTIDFLDIAPLLRTKADDLSWLQAAVVEQIGQSLLTRTRHEHLEHLPQITAADLVYCIWLTLGP